MEQARYLEVRAGVRYWEDATLNGKEDLHGEVPLRKGDDWCPVIELATGRILDWPAGVEARIHYKVCDDGEYWLQNAARQRIARWEDEYVPDDILCVGENGYGDYIILTVGADGLIGSWRAPELDPDEWTVVVSETPFARAYRNALDPILAEFKLPPLEAGGDDWQANPVFRAGEQAHNRLKSAPAPARADLDEAFNDACYEAMKAIFRAELFVDIGPKDNVDWQSPLYRALRQAHRTLSPARD